MTNLTTKANDNHIEWASGNITLPLPSLDRAEATEMELYARFMRHLRMVPNSRMEIKILSALQFTADMMDMSDALVSKMLADMGLRAPRSAFPEAYLEYIDRSLLRSGWEIGGPCASSLALKAYWDKIGEDRFAAFKRFQDLAEEPVPVS